MFKRHLEVGFEENYSRIVENTLTIRGRGAKFTPTPREESTILAAADLAKTLLRRREYAALKAELADTVERNRDPILAAAMSENVNLRGNTIEQIITNSANLHRAEDIAETLPSGVVVNIDVKTKLVGRKSSPKAYNIDKLLRLLAAGNTVFAFLFIGIDVAGGKVSPQFVSFLDSTILAMTRVQSHWAGLNSRGVTQLSGDLSRIFAPGFREVIDVAKSRTFLERLLAM